MRLFKVDRETHGHAEDVLPLQVEVAASVMAPRHLHRRGPTLENIHDFGQNSIAPCGQRWSRAICHNFASQVGFVRANFKGSHMRRQTNKYKTNPTALFAHCPSPITERTESHNRTSLDFASPEPSDCRNPSVARRYGTAKIFGFCVTRAARTA